MGLGAVFAGTGNYAGRKVNSKLDGVLPTHIGGPAPNHNLAALLQPTPGYPNPVLPSHVGEAVDTTISGITDWAPWLFEFSDSDTSGSTNTSTVITDSGDTEDSKQ